SARLTLLYAGEKLEFDAEEQIEVTSPKDTGILFYKGVPLPIYGTSISFAEKGTAILSDAERRPAITNLHRGQNSVVKRIGYSLFSEIATLLTAGQPAAYAGAPTLDLHIALLREMIVACGITLAEVPPIPTGHPFIACLTHDVDHPSVREHRWDHTMFGFLYRAVFGSVGQLIRGRIQFNDLITNWAAAFKLPFVYMGVANDFWCGFEDRYLQLEKGLGSTFFVIPFKNYAGKDTQGLAPRKRASRYQARDIANAIRKIVEAGCEVGLHGIDAWLDSPRAYDELQEIRNLTGSSKIGVRMHWLYYGNQSPMALEQAGAAYDSSVGYRETVGYRAGTTQAFKPPEVERLLELPMHVMDTALFYPDYLGLSPRKAGERLGAMVDHAARMGGCLTINWHDRSLAPERLWDGCYRDLIQDFKSRNVWFATAGQAISWFQKRRSVVFEMENGESDAVFARVTGHHDAGAPGLRLRVHRPREPFQIAPSGSETYVDIAFDENLDARVPVGVSA
ncbi:MAG: hypothetical protein QOF56_3404, partial [Acidobacteriaceae bacterium]|nr:hypothetical protein [Acidobacteriaceae bacterium]